MDKSSPFLLPHHKLLHKLFSLVTVVFCELFFLVDLFSFRLTQAVATFEVSSGGYGVGPCQSVSSVSLPPGGGGVL